MKCDKCSSTNIEQKDCKVYTKGPKVKKSKAFKKRKVGEDIKNGKK